MPRSRNFARRLVVGGPLLTHIAEDHIALVIEKGRLDDGADVVLRHEIEGAVAGEVGVDHVVAGVRVRAHSNNIGKGLDDHVHGPIAAGVDAHVPPVLLSRAEIAAQLLRVEPVVVAHLRLALKRLIHIGRVRAGAAVDGHLQPAQPQPLIAKAGMKPGLRGPIVELLFALLLAEAVPAQHHVDAHRELAACIGGLIGLHLEWASAPDR